MKKNVLLVWIAVTMMILSTGCGNQEEKAKNAAPMRVQSEVVHPSSDVHTKSYVGVVEEDWPYRWDLPPAEPSVRFVSVKDKR